MHSFMLRRGLALALAGVALSAPGNSQNIKAELIDLTGGRPVAVTAPAGDSARVFVVNKYGWLHIVKHGNTLNQPFLEWQSHCNINGEGGLLGLAFHPDYANNGYFYISYTADFQNGASVVSRLSVDPNDPDKADPNSEVIVWGPHPAQLQSHKAGSLEFGPDGLLYFSLGDGSDGGSLLPTAQDLLDPRGSILRFDVDLPHPHIPPSNPFVGDPTARDEIFVFGLRNPWGLAIDPLLGDLFIGDVGSGAYEEINWVPGGAPGGDNFGWPCFEGPSTTACGACQPNPVQPIVADPHTAGRCIVAGAVYRGSAIPELQGKLVYCDFSAETFWTLDWDGVAAEITEITSQLGGGLNTAPVAIGSDGLGELYIVNHFSSRLWKIVPDCAPPANVCATSPNSTGAGALLSSSGTPFLSAGDFVLETSAVPPFKSGIFFYGAGPEVALAFGEGLLCIQPPFARLPLVHADASGSMSLALDASLGNPSAPIASGTSYLFQCWYRDPDGGPAGFNTSDALLVEFCH